MTEPRVFSVPEPGPEVTCVRDRAGDLWWRRLTGSWFCSQNRAFADSVSESNAVHWADSAGPCGYLPLTDVTAEMEPRIPPYPTPEAYEAAVRALDTLREKFRALAALARSDGMDSTATNVQRVLEGKYDPRDEARRQLLEF